MIYEIQYNDAEYGDGRFAFYPTTRQPVATNTYRRLWGG